MRCNKCGTVYEGQIRKGRVTKCPNCEAIRLQGNVESRLLTVERLLAKRNLVFAFAPEEFIGFKVKGYPVYEGDTERSLTERLGLVPIYNSGNYKFRLRF